LVFEQFDRLHRWMFGVAAWTVKLKDGSLLAIRSPKVRRAVFPSIEARLVLPMVVLPSHNHRLLFPNKALAHGPARIFSSATEVVALRVCVPDIKHRASLHDCVRSNVSVTQKQAEAIVAHLVVLDSERVFGLALIRHVIWRIGQPHINKLAIA
jgi:hypothetical protein